MDKNDTFSYKGWLISDKFWKRATAVFGYYMVGYLIFFLGLAVILVFFYLISLVLGLA